MRRDFDWNRALNGELGDDAKRNAEWMEGIARDLGLIASGEMLLDADGACRRPTGAEDEQELDKATMWDYLGENYGVRFTVDEDLELRSVAVMVAFGGPNVWVDTGEEAVELFWGTGYACYPLSTDAIDAVNGWAEELFKDKVS